MTKFSFYQEKEIVNKKKGEKNFWVKIFFWVKKILRS